VGFREAVNSCLKKYVEFGGRAPRSEYWFFTLFFFLAAVGIVLFGFAISAATRPAIGIALAGVTIFIFVLGMFLPHLAVTVRRLHDIDISGWLYLIAFIPFGGFALFVCSLIPGTRGTNRFGPDPFEEERVADVFN
jgi:uncharacterized membrane protein YhaH (DUF805 family)